MNIKDFYNRNKKLISLALLGAIFFLLFIYLRDRREGLRLLLDLSVGNIALLVAAAVLFKIALGFNFKVVISFFDISLSFVQWLGLTCMASMANYLLPAKAGFAAQAVYLKKEFGLRYANFLNSVTGFYAVGFLVNAIVGTLLSIVLVTRKVDSGSFIFTFFLCVFVFTAVFIFIIYHFPKISSKAGILKGFFEGFKYFHNKPATIFYLALTQVGVIIAISLRLMIAFRVLGINMDIVSATIIALITSFSIILSITPGNLGIKEALIMFSASAFGVDPAQGIIVAMLDRMVDVVVSFSTGYGFTYYLTNRKPVIMKDKA